MKYLDTKENSIEDSVTRVLMGEKLVGGQKKLDKDKEIVYNKATLGEYYE